MKKSIVLMVHGLLLLCHQALASPQLTPYQQLDTNGARDVTPFVIDDRHYMVIPQLAKDIPNTKANMNGGNSDVDVLIYRWRKDKFEIYQRLPGHGNESSEFFEIGSKKFLAIASIHSGPKPPFITPSYSMLYEWDGERFVPVQQFYGYASKSWKYFNLGDRHFLALANGVVLPNSKAKHDTSSVIYEYDGQKFIPFQTIPSSWAYQWEFFTIAGKHYLGLTDHLQPSKLYRWNGKQFSPFQEFTNTGGRAFTHFKIQGLHYLAFANISHPSVLYRWNGQSFEQYQEFQGLGGRNFLFYMRGKTPYLMRINFITGSRSNPKSNLASPLYAWKEGKFEIIQEIETFGGVNAAYFAIKDQKFIAIANSLSKDLRFKTHSILYQLQ